MVRLKFLIAMALTRSSGAATGAETRLAEVVPACFAAEPGR